MNIYREAKTTCMFQGGERGGSNVVMASTTCMFQGGDRGGSMEDQNPTFLCFLCELVFFILSFSTSFQKAIFMPLFILKN